MMCGTRREAKKVVKLEAKDAARMRTALIFPARIWVHAQRRFGLRGQQRGKSYTRGKGISARNRNGKREEDDL